MSDHGEMLGDHGLTAKGCRFYEGAVRVPLIVPWPGRFRQAVVADGLMELTDVAPTLAELTGEPLPWTRCEHYDYYDVLNMYLPQPRSRAATPPAGPPCTGDHRHKLVTYHGLGHVYDLERDPLEVSNLWDDPSAATLRANLTQHSFDATMAACDPGLAQIGRF